MPDLEMEDREDGAYVGNAPRYGADLSTEDARGEVKCSRHHVVSNASLRQFWNIIIKDNALFELLRGFFATLLDNFERYEGLDFATAPEGTRRKGWEEQIKKFKELLGGFATPQPIPAGSQYRQNTVPFDEGHGDAFAEFAKIFQWLPGNLFIGPSPGSTPFTRSDDPAKKGTKINPTPNFEERAKDCMAQRADAWFANAVNANQAIASLAVVANGAAAGNAVQATQHVMVVASWLQETAALLAVSPMKAGAWDWGKDVADIAKYQRYWLKDT